MKTLESVKEIKDVLENRVYVMKNLSNRHAGEVTVLNHIDVGHIAYDATHHVGTFALKVEHDESTDSILVTYPRNICTLENSIRMNTPYRFKLAERQVDGSITSVEGRSLTIETLSGEIIKLKKPEKEIKVVLGLDGTFIFGTGEVD